MPKKVQITTHQNIKKKIKQKNISNIKYNKNKKKNKKKKK